MSGLSKRYKAFISYSQKDKKWARKIHRALESYRVPKGMYLSNPGNKTDTSRKLGHFFRDEDDFGGAPSLSASIAGAIDDSEHLIVVCSPNTLDSKWVNDEIIRFKSGRNLGNVFAIIIDGVPNATKLGIPEKECFPIALRKKVTPKGNITDIEDEPLAPNLTKESLNRVVVKVAAGLLSVPFDELWEREKKRSRNKKFIKASLIGITLLILTGFWFQIQNEKRKKYFLERDAKLATVINQIGNSKEVLAFQTLRDLLSDNPSDIELEEKVNTILSWAKTPTESIQHLHGPRLFEHYGELFFKSVNGTVVKVDAQIPQRRIGFKDGKMLLFFEDKIVLMDKATGDFLDVLGDDSNGSGGAYEYSLRFYDWDGLAFETSTGVKLVPGAYVGGTTNGTYYHAFVVVSKADKISIQLPVNHPDAKDGWESRYVSEIYILEDCKTIGLGNSTVDEGVPQDSIFLVDVRESFKFNGKTNYEIGAPLEIMPAFSDRQGYYISGKYRIEERKCLLPLNDTRTGTKLISTEGAILNSSISNSISDINEWRSYSPVPKDYEKGFNSGEWNHRPAAHFEGNPCPYVYQNGKSLYNCTLVNGRHKDTGFDSEYEGSPGWVKTSKPHHGKIKGEYANTFKQNPVITYHVQNNGGVQSVWCRKSEGKKYDCITFLYGIEYSGDWDRVDLRSYSGRYLYYYLGGDIPFKLLDLHLMKDVTPNPFLGSIDVAAFEDNIKDRLFVISNGRFYVLGKDHDNQIFKDVSDSLKWNKVLSENENEDFVGIIPYKDEGVIVISSSGRMIRLDINSGNVAWENNVVGIGEVNEIRSSPNREFIVVIGSKGIRLIRSTDGIFMSGVLLPPYFKYNEAGKIADCSEEYMSNQDKITDIMSDIQVNNDKSIMVRCGISRWIWKPKSYSGNQLVRLGQLVQASIVSPKTKDIQ